MSQHEKDLASLRNFLTVTQLFRLATELNTPEQSARTINFLLSLKGTLHVILACVQVLQWNDATISRAHLE